VSCSPFRVPIARFAAAQAAIETPRDTKKAKATGKATKATKVAKGKGKKKSKK